LVGVNPHTCEAFAHTIIRQSDGRKVTGPGSGTFLGELQRMIEKSDSLEDFNAGMSKIISDWQIDPSLIPDFITLN